MKPPTISHLVIDDKQNVSGFISTSDEGVTKIVFESWTDLQWFAVYMDSDVIKRINPRYVIEVGYAQSES